MSTYFGRQLAGSLALLRLLSSLAPAAASVVFNGESYQYSRNASIHDDLDLYWTVDAEQSLFSVAVHAKAARGWLGFGVSEMGGMEGADIMYYETESGNVTDAHALTTGRPVADDDCAQHWTLLSADVGAEGLIVRAERPLETLDVTDWAIVDDSVEGSTPTRVLTAWGDEGTISYHGERVAQAHLFLFGEQGALDPDPLAKAKADSSVATFIASPDEFAVPTNETWYEETCIPLSELPAEGEFHAVGFEGLLDNTSSEYVHHLVLKGYYDPDCGLTEGGSYVDMFFWAHGVRNMALPDDVGFRFTAADGGFRSIVLQTHYNNPAGHTGVLDSSGVIVYYSETFLLMDMGTMQLGDPSISLIGVPLPDGKSRYSFSCPASCTSDHFELNNVTVFQHSLHMHAIGQRSQTRHYRGDELVRTLNVDYYAFEQAGGYVLGAHDSGTLYAGDRFETECMYDTSLSSRDTVYFGLGSAEEMCVDFVFYYPAQPIPYTGACGPFYCGGAMTENVSLGENHDFNRTFGIVVEACDEEEGSTENDVDDDGDFTNGNSTDDQSGQEEITTDGSNAASRSVFSPHPLGIMLPVSLSIVIAFSYLARS